MAKIILPGAWELTQDDKLPLYSLTVPTQWRQRARYLEEERKKNTGKYPSVSVSSLDPIVSASFPQIIKTVRKGWQKLGIPWLYALEQVDLSHLPNLTKDWLREEFVWCLGQETVNNVLNNLNDSDWQWDNTTIDLSLLEPPAEGNVDFRFQAIPDYIAKKFLETENTIIFEGENVKHELKFYPVVRLNQGAELMSYPPYEVPLIENKEHKGDENNPLPLSRVGETEEISNKYVSYWGEKVKNDDSDSSTPMHRPSLAASAVFAEREIPLKTILIVWETKQCRDELIKEICNRLFLTSTTETQTQTHITVGGGEVKETNYTSEYGSICIKTIHVADLTQNFTIGWKEKLAEKQRKREQFIAERIKRIKAYLPLTQELCGAIIEIKSPPQFDKPSKPPEADPKSAWRIGAAQANYLNQHITSITAKKKETKKIYVPKKNLNRVKSAVTDLFRQFGILPTFSKKLIDPEKDRISLYTWLTCFYVLRRTRQTSESNSASTVVLMLRANPVNGEVEITTPAWFQDDTKGWLSYPLAEKLLLNEKWHPDSNFDDTSQEEDEEETSTRREREQKLIDKFVSDCLQDCLNTSIEEEKSPHVLFMAEAQNARKLLKWLQNPYVPEEYNILPKQLNRQLSKQEKQRLSIVPFRETKQNETPVAILKNNPHSKESSGIFKWRNICDNSEQNIYLSIRKGLNTEQRLLRNAQSRLDNGKSPAGNRKPIEIIVVYSSTIEQDTLAKFVHNLRDRNPYYSDFNTLPFPFSLAIPTKEYAIGIRDRVESEQSDEEE